MKNLTFIEYVVTLDILKGCIILAEYLWSPDNGNEDAPFWDFCYTLFSDIYGDYRKKYNKTETLTEAVRDTVCISKMIEKRAIEKGEREREKRQADSFVFE